MYKFGGKYMGSAVAGNCAKLPYGKLAVRLAPKGSSRQNQLGTLSYVQIWWKVQGSNL